MEITIFGWSFTSFVKHLFYGKERDISRKNVFAYPRSKHVKRTLLSVRRAGKEYYCDDCGEHIERGDIHAHGNIMENRVRVPRQFCKRCYVEIKK